MTDSGDKVKTSESELLDFIKEKISSKLMSDAVHCVKTTEKGEYTMKISYVVEMNDQKVSRTSTFVVEVE